jgi:hypothetical protein
MLAPQPREVDLDADLEHEEDDPEVGQQLTLRPIGGIAGREWRHREAESEVADDRRQPEPTRSPADDRRTEQLQARSRGLSGRSPPQHPAGDRAVTALGDGHAREARQRIVNFSISTATNATVDAASITASSIGASASVSKIAWSGGR